MKKIMSIIAVTCLCFGLVGCGSQQEWKEPLEYELEKVGVDDVNWMTADGYEKGDDQATITIETKTMKLEAKLTLRNDEWGVLYIKEKHSENYYYVSKNIANSENYSIYDYKTGEWLNPKEEENNQNNETDAPVGVSKSVQFIRNGYKEFEGNYRKDIEVNGSKMYMLFQFFNDSSVNLFSVSDDFGNSTSYYYNAGWAGQNSCKFNVVSGTVNEGSSCSETEIENAKSTKGIFDKELNTLDLKIEDLNK